MERALERVLHAAGGLVLAFRLVWKRAAVTSLLTLAGMPAFMTAQTPTPPSSPPSDDVESGFGIGVAVAYDQFRDDLLTPLRWGGPAAALQVVWGRATPRGRHDLSLFLPVSFLENRFGDPGYALGIELAYTYDRRIATGFAGGSVYLGGTLEWDLHDGFYESWDDEHIYWLNSYSLGPRAGWRRALGRSTRLSVALDLPLIALVSRPPAVRLSKTDDIDNFFYHVTEPQRDLVLTGFPRYSAFHVGLALARRWGGSWLEVTYDLEFSSYDSPARVVTLSNRLGVSRRATW